MTESNTPFTERLRHEQLLARLCRYCLQLRDGAVRRHRINALPIVDRHMRILGIVTLADFMRHANVDMHGSMGERLHALLEATTTVHTSKPEVVGQMTAHVRVASSDRHIIELVPIFSEDGHHHRIGLRASVVSKRRAVDA